VRCELRLAGKDHAAALALEMVLLKVRIQNVKIGSVEVAAGLQAVLVF
jgi:hypothetical protein